MTSTNYHGHHNQVPWPPNGAKIGNRLKIYGTFSGQEGRFSCTAIQDLADACPTPGPWKLILGFGARQNISLYTRTTVGRGPFVRVPRWHKRLPVTKVDGRISAVPPFAWSPQPAAGSPQVASQPCSQRSPLCEPAQVWTCVFYSEGSRSAHLEAVAGNFRFFCGKTLSQLRRQHRTHIAHDVRKPGS